MYAALAKHKDIDAGNISVVARNGAVALNGTVTESSQLGTVADIAKGVPATRRSRESHSRLRRQGDNAGERRLILRYSLL